jgi:hypothetical protein
MDKNNKRVNNNYRKSRRIGNTPQTPANSSPTTGSRACLCKDARTYSKECCDGSLWAQGIGVIQKVT